jgi:hypothetical protein
MNQKYVGIIKVKSPDQERDAVVRDEDNDTFHIIILVTVRHDQRGNFVSMERYNTKHADSKGEKYLNICDSSNVYILYKLRVE